MAILLATLVVPQLPIHAQEMETAGASQPPAATPFDPTRWNKEQEIVQRRRQKFLAHLDSAKNVKTPVAPKEFRWKINWHAQQAYCKDMAAALFEDRRRLSFPEPLYSQWRDPVEKLPAVLEVAMPGCKNRDWVAHKKRTISDLTKLQIAAAATPAGGIPSGSFSERFYVSPEGLVQEWVSLDKAHDFGYKNSITFEYADRRDDGCWPGGPNSEYGYDPYVQTRSATNYTDTILFAIDGKLVVGVFGIVDAHEVKSPFVWPGQGFVFAHGLKENLFEYFALTPPPSQAIADGSRTGVDPERLHPYACFIRFDVTSPARSQP